MLPLCLVAALLLLASGPRPSLGDEAIHCPPCSEEKLARCRPPVGCEELVREPGCGCCATCALGKGMPCGVYTPRCGSGLRCYPPRGVEKPLHTLMHGQGLCMELAEIEAIQESLQPSDKDEGDHPNNSFSPCSPQDRRCLQKHLAKIRDRSTSGGKMKVIGAPREEARPVPQGSCQSELHRALERLAASQRRTHEDLYIIPIPNCDRNGNFHPKQVGLHPLPQPHCLGPGLSSRSGPPQWKSQEGRGSPMQPNPLDSPSTLPSLRTSAHFAHSPIRQMRRLRQG
uniref:Insulin-like growth factor-binding protein 4 n=1 Tax=Sus scrofa TaxID=9823 RepID=A0A8D1J4T5_PIG